jgi:vancomycin resistance protein VanJ
MSASTNRRRSPAFWPAVVLCWLYLLPVAVYLALRGTALYLPQTLTSLGFLGPWLFLPLLVILPVAAWLRARLTLLGAAALLAFAVFFYAPFYVHTAPAAGSAPSFTALTYNLHAGVPPTGPLVEAIRQQNADIVAVEELTPETASAFATYLGSRYPYRLLDTDNIEVGLLSRFPILSSERFQPAGTGRTALHVLLDVNGAPLQLLIVHPEPPGICRPSGLPIATGACDASLVAEMADIARRASALQRPVLVMGDMNTVDLSRPYTRIAGVLTDAYREAGTGLGFTFPVGLRLDGIYLPGPLLRIDYMFHSAGLRTLQARVNRRGGSDHASLWARFAME